MTTSGRGRRWGWCPASAAAGPAPSPTQWPGPAHGSRWTAGRTAGSSRPCRCSVRQHPGLRMADPHGASRFSDHRGVVVLDQVDHDRIARPAALAALLAWPPPAGLAEGGLEVLQRPGELDGRTGQQHLDLGRQGPGRPEQFPGLLGPWRLRNRRSAGACGCRGTPAAPPTAGCSG